MDGHIYTRLIVSLKYGVKLVLLCGKGVEIFDEHTWYVYKYKDTFYVKRSVRVDGKRTMSFLHREIMKLKRGKKMCVDHQNRNGLDNQVSNLRICTNQENNHNQARYEQ